MSERPTLYAEKRGQLRRIIDTSPRFDGATLQEWNQDDDLAYPDLLALWRILPRWCDTDECDGTGRVPTVNEKWLTLERVFLHRACDGRGWLYPDTPKGWGAGYPGGSLHSTLASSGEWDVEEGWHRHLIDTWRAMGILEDTDE